MENETRPVRAVIYDMDGVIIDSEPVYKAIEMGFYNELGITLTQERLIGSIGRSALEWWTEIGEEFALDIDPQELTDRENQAYQDFLDDPERIKPLIPDFPETVRKLSDRNIKIGVASGSAKNSIGKVLRLADPTESSTPGSARRTRSSKTESPLRMSFSMPRRFSVSRLKTASSSRTLPTGFSRPGMPECAQWAFTELPTPDRTPRLPTTLSPVIWN